MLASELHFSNFLTLEHINQVKTDFGFQNAIPIEKFIMDFETFFHIQEYIPDSIVKGGMSVPFHLPDNTARRLSVDIDIVTSMSKDQVIEVIGKVSNKLKEAIRISENYKPNKPKKDLKLLTYFPKFDSCLGDEGEIKVDITYDFTESIPVRKITRPIDLFACGIDFPFNTYKIGSLIGDKITTLGFSTIGIDTGRADEWPKQIYDVATLTKYTTSKEDFVDVADSFQVVSEYERTVFANEFTDDNIMNDILSSMTGLLENNNGYHLAGHYVDRHETFRNQLLIQNRYLKQEHATDILIVKYLVKKIKDLSNSMLTKENFAKDCFTDIQEFNRIKSLDGTGKRTEHNKIKAKHSTEEEHIKLIKAITVEQSFLYDKIIS